VLIACQSSGDGAEGKVFVDNAAVVSGDGGVRAVAGEITFASML